MAQTTFKSIVSIAVILIIASLGVGYFGTLKVWGNYSTSKTQLAQLQKDNQHLTETLSLVQSFLDNYKTHQKDAVKVSLALPLKSADLADFMSGIEDLGKSSGILLSNISFEEPTAKAADNSIQALPVSLSASGSYASFKDFILRLETHLRLIDLVHVTAKADDSGQIQYQITFNTYYQK
jgi:Tfp pilus assembly protein PilO